MTTVSLDRSVSFCRSLARRSGRNFYYSFLTLPSSKRDDMCVLYSFMRLSDDLVDDQAVDAFRRSSQLDDWRSWLRLALEEDRYEHPVFPALAELVDRCRLPHRYLHSVLDGIEMDLQPVRFDTVSELERYCYHVAGVVGLCCIHVWGFDGTEATDLAVDCGTAFQLTNILRDLREDLQQGRVYLPTEDWQQFGCSPHDVLANGIHDDFEELIRFEVERTRTFYARGRELLHRLSPEGVPILSAMLRIYGGILDQIDRRPADILVRRIGLSRLRKLLIAGDEIVRGRWRNRFRSAGPSRTVPTETINQPP